MRTSSPGAAYGNERRNAASTTANMAVVAPMPRPTVATIVSASRGERSRLRQVTRRSCSRSADSSPIGETAMPALDGAASRWVRAPSGNELGDARARHAHPHSRIARRAWLDANLKIVIGDDQGAILQRQPRTDGAGLRVTKTGRKPGADLAQPRAALAEPRPV